jgi:ubiquinone/menaquinone biosynthesis C-methylase UbiE
MGERKYIAALKFPFLTKFYDFVVGTLMPEKKIKSSIIRLAKIDKETKVLDFGIGTATLSIIGAKQHPEAYFTGLDIDAEILKIAKKKISEAGVAIELVEYNGGKLPFEDDTFDRIISCLVFHHLSDSNKLEILKEFDRILKPNGEIHIGDWGKASNKLMRLLFHFVQLLDGYGTTNSNVRGKLPNIIHEAGFRSVTIQQGIDTILGTMELLKITKQTNEYNEI